MARPTGSPWRGSSPMPTCGRSCDPRSGAPPPRPEDREEDQEGHTRPDLAAEDDAVDVHRRLPADPSAADDIDADRPGGPAPAAARARAGRGLLALPALAGAGARAAAQGCRRHQQEAVALDRLAVDAANGERVAGLLENLRG